MESLSPVFPLTNSVSNALGDFLNFKFHPSFTSSAIGGLMNSIGERMATQTSEIGPDVDPKQPPIV